LLNQNGFLAAKKHKDEIAFIKNLSALDECEVIKNIDKWEIESLLDNDANEENNLPDWYGYKIIDII
tara:strand:- start:191 stop:391 length:201 start_codon:yes stop_codon:yes gene_type:complete